MQEQSETYSIKLMSKILDVSRSGYYEWLTRTLSNNWKEDLYLSQRIKTIYYENKQRYGSPRIRVELREDGFNCSRNRVASLMRKQGLAALPKRRFRVTTKSDHNLVAAPNLVEMRFTTGKGNTLWTSDITYIWTKEGWLYLSVILDMWSRSVIGWNADRNMDEGLVVKALYKALTTRKPSSQVILHSD